MQPICSLLYKCDAADLLALQMRCNRFARSTYAMQSICSLLKRGTTDLFALQYNEINSLIQLGAISPIHNGPMQIELNNRSRHINIRFHALRHEADFFTKQLPTPLYERARRDLDANESYSN
jgi:hypothetical protein